MYEITSNILKYVIDNKKMYNYIFYKIINNFL